MENENQYICPVMQSLINQLKERNIPLAESRMSDYHFHEFYFRVNANPEIIKTLHIEGAKVIDNDIVKKSFSASAVPSVSAGKPPARTRL